jgi:hypothetical protein
MDGRIVLKWMWKWHMREWTKNFLGVRTSVNTAMKFSVSWRRKFLAERLLVSQGVFLAVGQPRMKTEQFEMYGRIDKASEER